LNYKLRLEDDVSTHEGCVRSVNEDSFVARARDRVWAVADGMGGHKNGQYASQALAQEIGAASIPDDLAEACEVVAEAIHAANDTIYAESRSVGEQMGSTIVALVVRETEFALLWAGDSRAYLLRDDVLHQLSRDHTQVQEMLERGLLDAEQAENHPMGHVLARAVGVQDELEIDAISDTAVAGDVFLLCSDGLHGVLGAGEITEIVSRWGRKSAEKLVEACIEKGAPDNVTVAIVRAFEPTNLSHGTNQDMTR
jgi:serine/threonine protein phosphatase Stp1